MASWSQGETKLGPVARLEYSGHYEKIMYSKNIPLPGACRNSFLVFVSDRINLDSLKISELIPFS
jgi:hypothetical protein